MYVQKFLQPDACSTAHNLSDCLIDHETQVRQLSSLGVLGDQHLFRILEIGTLKRLCAKLVIKLSVPMLMFSERERAQGIDLDLLSLKAALMGRSFEGFPSFLREATPFNQILDFVAFSGLVRNSFNF